MPHRKSRPFGARLSSISFGRSQTWKHGQETSHDHRRRVLLFDGGNPLELCFGRMVFRLVKMSIRPAHPRISSLHEKAGARRRHPFDHPRAQIENVTSSGGSRKCNYRSSLKVSRVSALSESRACGGRGVGPGRENPPRSPRPTAVPRNARASWGLRRTRRDGGASRRSRIERGDWALGASMAVGGSLLRPGPGSPEANDLRRVSDAGSRRETPGGRRRGPCGLGPSRLGRAAGL